MTMLPIAAQLARRRIPSLVAVACAVFGGAAILTGTGVLAESGLRSTLPVDRLGGADVLVSATQTVRQSEELPIALPERGPVPAELTARLGDLPGVIAAVADVSFPAAAVAPNGAVVPVADARTGGHGWSSVGLMHGTTVAGRPPQGEDEVAVDIEIARAVSLVPGDRARLVVAGRIGEHRVSAVVTPAGAGILMADDTAAHLAGRDRGPRARTVDLIGLRVQPGAEARVANAARRMLADSGLLVTTGSDRGDAVLPEAAAARSLLVLLAASLAGVPLLIVGFVVAGALSVSVGGQRRELALLRAVGTTPRQVRALVAAQATVIGAAVLLPGAAAGYLLAGQFRRLLVGIGVLPEALPLTWSPLPALSAALLLLLVLQVAARCAAWRISREPVTTALAEARIGPRVPSRTRARAGVVLLAMVVPLSIPPLLVQSPVSAAATSVAGIVAAIGLTLAGPVLLTRRSGGLSRRLPAGTSAPSWLAVANLNGYAMRSAGAVSTLAMAVVLVLTYALAQTTVIGAGSRDVDAGTRASATIGAPGLGGIPDGTVAALKAMPGVRAVAPVSSTTVLVPVRMLGQETLESQPALVLTPASTSVLDLDVRDGALANLTGATVAVSRDVARGQDLAVGDHLGLVLGDGARVTPRVAAVYDRGLGFGGVVLSKDLARGHTTLLDQTVLVATDGSARTERTLAGLVSARPGVTLSLAAPGSGGHPSAPPETWINLAVIGVLLGYVLLGIANALVASTAQRREELASLRLIGTTPRQVRAMMRREAALISVSALTAGVAVSALPLALLGIGFLGRPWPTGPAWLLPGVAVVVAAIAFLAIELTTRITLRTTPAEVLAQST